MKRTTLVFLSLFLAVLGFAQEGTKQLMPNSTDRVYLLINPSGYTDFAEYGCEERERLYIYLKAGEKLHLGMATSSSSYKYRLKDPSDAIVIAEATVPQSGETGYIDNYTEAITGANGTIINGSTITGGYEPIIYTAATTGNHYLEFNGSGEMNIELFDATVTDASNNIITNPNEPNKSAGRLWSKQWQMNTTSFTQYPLNNDFFVFTGDEFVNKVTFRMKPYKFNFVSNSFGTDNTGNIIVDRQSLNGNAFDGDVTQYSIFLNDPDQEIFPSTSIPPPVVKAWFNDVLIYDYDYAREPQLLNINPGSITVNQNDGTCPYDDVVYFKIQSNISGQSTILIDVDGDGFKVGTDDVALLADISIGDNYIPWDMKDASGVTVSTGDFDCIPQLLARGPAHFPIYDAEALNGIETYSVRPFEKFDPTLYWDDNIIPANEWGDDNGNMDDTQVDQYRINADIPRIWTYFGDNGGYANGNNNTLNSWFYAIDLGLANLDFNIQQVGCVNGNAPIVSDIYKSAGINTDITFSTADFEAKYADAGANPINKIEIVNLPANGVLYLSGTPITAGQEILYADLGNIYFTPTTDWMGETTFDWNAHNGTEYAASDATVHITINTDPTISAIPDQNICVNTSTGPIPFTIGDAAGETDPNDMTVWASSGNLNVVAISGITFGGSGANRTIEITPVTNKSGSAFITVFASDGYSTVETSFWAVVGPSLEITGTTNVCPGDDLNLTANESGATYSWEFGGSEISTSQTLTVANFDPATDAGTYYLTVDNGTCTGTAEYEVSQHHLVSFVGNLDVCNGGTLSLTADEFPANDYSWRKGGTQIGTNRTLTIDPVAMGDAGTDYQLRVTKDGCTITSEPFEVTVSNCTPPAVTLSVDQTSIPENGGQAILTVELSNSWNHDVDVDLSYGGTATNITDYSVGATTVTIPSGSLTQTIDIDAFFDGVYEGDETVIADITNVDDGGNGAYEDGTQQQTITIVDNETPPVVSLSAFPTVINENGGTSTLTLTLSSVVGSDVTVNLSYGGTATNTTDYGVANSVVIPAGSLSITTTLTANNDAVYEGNETVVAEISSVSGGGASEDGFQSSTITITDDETAPILTVNDASATEGNNVEFTVSLSNESSEDITATLDLTDVTATGGGTDYTSTNVQVTISAGSTSNTVNVPTTNDGIYEGDETFTIGFVSVDAGTADADLSDEGTGTITDAADLPVLTVNDATATEGSDVQFTVSLSNASTEDITATLDLTDVTATGGGTDYTSTNVQVTINAGSTSNTVNIPTVNDGIYEGDETFTIGFVSVDAGTADADLSDEGTGTITDDESAPVLTVNDATATEGSDVQFTVSLSNASTEDITTTLDLTDVTATGGGTDYTSTNVQVTINAGSTSNTVNVPTVNDGIYEGDETFTIGFVSVDAGTADADLSDEGTGTITDAADLPVLTVNDATATEGSDVQFTVSLSNASTEDITTTLDLTDVTATGGGTDYTSTNVQVTINAGSTSNTVNVPTTNDAIYEGDETFTIGFVSVDAGTADADLSDEGTGTITDDESAPVLTVNDATAAEGSNVQFTVSLSGESSEDITTTLDLTDVTATGGGTDYTSTNVQVTINAGSTSNTVNVPTVNDGIYEGDETFTIGFVSVDAGTADADLSDEGTGTITDDESAPVLTVNDASATEGNNVQFTVSLSGESSEDITTTLDLTDVTATGGGTDYTSTNVQVTINAGSTSNTVNVPTVNDGIYEGDETFTIGFVSVDAGTADADLSDEGTGTITDAADLPVLTVNDANATEGNDVEFTVSLSNASTEDITATLDLTDVTATGGGTDYTSTNVQVTINAGSTSNTVNVPTTNDAIYEGDETFTIGFVSVDAGTADANLSDEGTGTITDDETQPTISISDASATEGDAGTTPMDFTVTLSNASYQTVTVEYATSDGTATLAGSDYVEITTSTLTFAPGETSKTVTVLINSDLINEGNENLFVDLSAPSNATILDNQGEGTIIDNDGPPQISISDASVVEGDAGTTPMDFTVSLSSPSASTITVDYATSDGTATLADTDYNEISTTTLTFNAGETSKTVTVLVNGDTKYEGDENLFVDLSNPTNATIFDNQGEGTITDDADVPVVTLSAAPTSIIENGGVSTLTATLSNATYEDVVVNLGYSGTAINTTDYGVSTSITITAGNTTGTTDITAIEDAIYEGNETVVAEISTVTGGGATEDGDQSETVTIDDDADMPAISINDASVAEGNSGTTDMDFTVSLSNASTYTVTVDYVTADGTATTANSDYVATSGTLTFNPSETSKIVTVVVNGDDIFEGDENMFVNLSNENNATIADDQGEGTILDDEGPNASDDTYVINEDETLNDDVSTNDSGLNNTPLDFEIISDPSNGTIVINDDGTFTYIPDPNFSGDDTFTYEVCDNGGECSTATVTVTVNPVNDPIYANDDTADVNEDGTLNGTTVLVNDGDDDGSTITINTTPVLDVTNGTLVINPDGTYTYTPDENFVGTDYFIYEICNDETPQECTTATVVITVNPTNDTPVAVDDFVYTDEGNPVSGDVIPNDSDMDGDNLIVNTTLLDEPNNGTVVINEDGTYTYTPDDDFVGTDIFIYQVCDDGTPELCTHAIVTIVVGEAGDLYANDDNAEVDEGGTLNGSSVLDNDGDSDGSDLTVNTTPIDDVNNGTLVLNEDGTYTYTPDDGFVGTDSFTYEVCNNEDPQECETATVIIVVNPVNENPEAGDDNVTTDQGNPVSGDVTTNDNDPDGDDLIVNTTPIDDVDNGTLVLNDDGTFTYTPDPGFTGTDTFTYEICDNGNPQLCTTATVTITVNTLGDIYANDDVAVVNEDGTLNGTTVLVNDGDSDGSTLTVNTTPIDDVDNGTLVLNEDGTYTYTPDPDFTGEDSFTYEVCNDEDPQQCTTATVTIIVQPVNDGLYANNDVAEVDEDEVLNGTTVLINDGDNDGSMIIVNQIPVELPEHGTLTINDDGTYTYTPYLDFTGNDSFVYEISNDENPQEFETAEVTITVNPVNDDPVAGDDIIITGGDTPIDGDVTPNDYDPDGDDLTVDITPIDGPDNGEIVINGDGTFTYTPDDGFVGTDTITYVICDDQTPPNCTEGEIIITVLPEGEIYANNDVAEIDEDQTLTGTTVLVNDGDSNGGTLTVNTTPVIDVTNGTLVLNEDGTYTYTPNGDFTGTDSFTYEVCNDDTPQQCTNATVIIVVNPVNDAPVAVDDNVFTEENIPVIGDVVPNDSDVDGDDLIVNTTPVVDVTNGTLVINGDGTFTYTPDNGFTGTDSFTYEICDDGTPQLCDQAVVTITVGTTGELYANDDYYDVFEDNILIGSTILVNDGDSDGSTITVNTTPISDVSNGTLTLNWNGTFTYSPNADYNGSDQFTYEITNDETPHESAQATVYITVNPVNDPPVAVDDFVTTFMDEAVTSNALDNDYDIDGDNLIINTTPVIFPTNGTVVINPDGTFTYTPDAGFVGTDNFVYQVCDDGTPQLCTQALVTINVYEVNSPIYANDDFATVNEDEVLNGTTVLANDGDADGSTITVNTTPISNVTYGELVINNDGTYTYTPIADFYGEDSFVYEISNDETPQEFATAVVTITVVPVNDTPVAVDDSYTTDMDVEISGDVSINDTGLGDTLVVFTIDTNTENGSVSFNDDGTFEYTPDTEFVGEDSFTYTVCDADGECSTAKAMLTVIGDVTTDITIPEGFSPNGDGDNETFIITGLEEHPENEIIILNRWGNKVYEAAPYNNDWDGTNMFGVSVGGDKLPVGTYFYILKLEDGKVEKGYIYLNK